MEDLTRIIEHWKSVMLADTSRFRAFEIELSVEFQDCPEHSFMIEPCAASPIRQIQGEAPRSSLSCESGVFVSLARGLLNPQEAFLNKLFSFRGQREDLLKFSLLLNEKRLQVIL